MRRWQITVTHVYVIDAQTQAEAVLQFEQDHPGQGGWIVKVEELGVAESARQAEARGRRDNV